MEFEQARESMVERQILSRGIHSPAVLEAMRKVPRHLFVGRDFEENAYEDHPLPIGEEQTISQPYMVALMTDLLDLVKDSKVLEIGTGSGYQTAVLAELAEQIYTVERLVPLVEAAQNIFQQLNYDNIQVLCADGTLGWSEHAPYDRIIVTAGAPVVPEALIEQLAENGKLVIPVGDRFAQVLKILSKQEDGRLHTENSCHCVFVKLIGKDGWDY